MDSEEKLIVKLAEIVGGIGSGAAISTSDLRSHVIGEVRFLKSEVNDLKRLLDRLKLERYEHIRYLHSILFNRP